MKVAITHYKNVSDNWIPFPTDAFSSPNEIRKEALSLFSDEQRFEDLCIVTMNRTVIDMIGGDDFVDYHNTYIYDGTKLVLLTDVYDEQYLCHFVLGDLFERDYFEESKIASILNSKQ